MRMLPLLLDKKRGQEGHILLPLARRFQITWQSGARSDYSICCIGASWPVAIVFQISGLSELLWLSIVCVAVQEDVILLWLLSGADIFAVGVGNGGGGISGPRFIKFPL